MERALFRFDRYEPTCSANKNIFKKLPLAETLIDKAIEVRFIGGVYGNQRPTEFLCLLLKLLQIQPEKEILVEYLQAEEFKYVPKFTLLCESDALIIGTYALLRLFTSE